MKPFDLLVIESPREYQVSTEENIQGLKELAKLCEDHQIPVCATRGTLEPFYDLTKPHFQNCDYRRGLDFEKLPTFDDSKKIIVSGGYLWYDQNNLRDRIEESNLDPDDLENIDPQDRSRQHAIVWGCVPAQAVILHRLLKTQNPNILIDPKSTVKCANIAEFDKDALYALHKYILKGEVVLYLVTKKVQRDSIIPQSTQ